MKRTGRFRGGMPAGIFASKAFGHSGRGHHRRSGLDRALSGALVLAVLAGLALGSAPARATMPGFNGKIACEGERRTGLPAGQSATEIFTVDPYGGGETVLTNNTYRDGDPSFSPDGKRIAFEGFATGSSEVYTMDADTGGNVVQLTSTPPATEDRGTSWSPDGSKIAFHSTRDPLPPAPPPGSSRFEIYTMNSDGTNQQRITNNLSQDTFPMWSPDGQRLAFTTNRDADFEIYTMKPDGSDVQRVTNSVGEDAHGSWSPDGLQLTFHSRRAGNIDIFRTNANGSGTPTHLTFGPAFDAFPIWSPDGTRITYSDLSSQDIFHISALDGGDLTRLTSDPGSDNRCDWQTLQPVGVPTPVPGPTTTVVSGTSSTSTGAPSSAGGDRPGPPLVELGGSATQKLGSTIQVVAESDEQATLQADGTIAAPKTVANLNAAQRKAKTFRIPGVQADAPPRAKVTLRLQVPRKAVSAIKRKLTRGRRSTARIKVVATDLGGNQRTVFRTIRITR